MASLATLLIYVLLYGFFDLRLPYLNPPLFFLMASGLLLLWRYIQHSAPHGILLLSGRSGCASLRQELLLGVSLGLFPILVFAFVHAFNPARLGPALSLSPQTPWAWVSLLLIAPLGEELFFRGFLLQDLENRFNKRFAVIVQAWMFMWCHASFALGPLALGLIGGVLAQKRRHLLAPLVLHVLANTYGPVIQHYFSGATVVLTPFLYTP